MRIEHPGWPGRINARTWELPDDSDAQVAATISLMRELALADARTPAVRDLARGLPPSSRATVDAVFWMVRRAVRFRRDVDLTQGVEGWSPDIIEVLIRPVDLLTMQPPQGDCDDFSMLVASLLVAAGVRCSFVTVAADPLEPTRYSHVYVVAHLPEGDVAVDASHGREPGWEAPNAFGKRREWSLQMHGVSGLGQSNVPMFSTTVTANANPTIPWWQQLVNRGLDIVQQRVGPGENTWTRLPDGTTIIRGSETMAPTGTPTEFRGTIGQQSDILSSIGGGVVLAFLGLLLLIFVVSRGRK